jgi:hypothetical protein
MNNYPFLHESKQPSIEPPEDGWKEHHVYLVAVAWSPGNPIHRALFHVGFLDDSGEPGNYSEIWANDYDYSMSFQKAHYLRVIKELATAEEMGKE